MGYSITDAIKDLTPILDKCPLGSQSGTWLATTMQAATSSFSGGYLDAQGGHISQSIAGWNDGSDLISDIIEKLAAETSQPFNKVSISWTKSKIPFMAGRVNVKTTYDQSIVPRGPDDPIYAIAAAIRLAYWQTRGEVAEDYAAQLEKPNVHNQTNWFGPHRRVLKVETRSSIILATDGLSTPWAGVPDKENGVECEVYLEFERAIMNPQKIDDWGHLLINLGDMIADGYRVASDVSDSEAIIFCKLTDDYAPMTRMVLTIDQGSISDMPFGAVPLIKAIPIAEEEIEGLDLSDAWSATAAKAVLTQRQAP